MPETPRGGSRCLSPILSLTSALYVVGILPYALGALPPGKNPGTHCKGGGMGLGVGLDGFGEFGLYWDSILGPSICIASRYTS